MNCVGISPQLFMRDYKSSYDQLIEFRKRASEYFISVNHQNDLISQALDELVQISVDSSNLDKIEPVLSLLLFMFYNRSCFEACLKDGLFNKLIKLFSNVKQLDYETVGTQQRKVAVNKKTKLKIILSIVNGLNYCFDLVKEQNKFSDLTKISKDEFESLTLILQLIEDNIGNSTTVEHLLSFMLRVINLAYNPDAVAVQPEEFTQAILKLDKDLICFKLGQIAKKHDTNQGILALIRTVKQGLEDLVNLRKKKS